MSNKQKTIFLKYTFTDLLHRLLLELFQNNRELKQILRLLHLVKSVKTRKNTRKQLLIEIQSSLFQAHLRSLHIHRIKLAIHQSLFHPLQNNSRTNQFYSTYDDNWIPVIAIGYPPRVTSFCLLFRNNRGYSTEDSSARRSRDGERSKPSCWDSTLPNRGNPLLDHDLGNQSRSIDLSPVPLKAAHKVKYRRKTMFGRNNDHRSRSRASWSEFCLSYLTIKIKYREKILFIF